MSVVVRVGCLGAVLAGCRAEGGGQQPVEPFEQGSSFAEVNGFLWIYNLWRETPFADVTARLDELHDRGFRVLGFYVPYDSDVRKFLGGVALDGYATAPVCGSLAEWQALVDGAHERGMRVVTYMGPTMVDARSALFTTAEAQYAAGDRTSREVSAFRWSDTDTAELPVSEPGPSQWAYSDTAGAYYWELWHDPGLDVTQPGGLAEVQRFVSFWLDTGLDGFMWDSADTVPELQPIYVDLPRSYLSDPWLTFESTAYRDADEYAAFGLTSWFNLEDDDLANDYSYVAGGDSADYLERALARTDAAHALGGFTHAWTPWDGYTSYPDEDRMRVQEAAVLAGAGVHYGLPEWEAYEAWPEARKQGVEQVLRTVNGHPSLAPGASRARVPAGPGERVYAMARTSPDGGETALLVYNLSPDPKTIELDLADVGLVVPQTPEDWIGGGSAERITSTTWAIPVEGYGFRMLGVRK